MPDDTVNTFCRKLVATPLKVVDKIGGQDKTATLCESVISNVVTQSFGEGFSLLLTEFNGAGIHFKSQVGNRQVSLKRSYLPLYFEHQ